MDIFCSSNRNSAFSFKVTFFNASAESKITTDRESFAPSSVIGESSSWLDEIGTCSALMSVDCAFANWSLVCLSTFSVALFSNPMINSSISLFPIPLLSVLFRGALAV
eukprot:IDg8339t1